MDIWTILLIALGLAMDAFAVSLGAGTSELANNKRARFRLAFHFGWFQAMMPVIGWLAGQTVAQYISAFDHWVAFALLAAIGGKMIYEALGERDEEAQRKDPTKGASLVVLSVATSIDALAVGLSLALLGTAIWYPALVIGIVALVFTAVGLHLGRRFGALLGRRMEIVGGLILVAIGLRILIDHLAS